MILTENVGNRIRHYSDKQVKIRQIETEKVYDDAIDIIPCKYTYEETDEPIEVIEEPTAEEILDILLGGAE